MLLVSEMPGGDCCDAAVRSRISALRRAAHEHRYDIAVMVCIGFEACRWGGDCQRHFG